MAEISKSPDKAIELEKECKISFVNMSLETIDKETKWNFIKTPKSTEWVESLKMLQDTMLQNISSSLRLKFETKTKKTRTKFTTKFNEKEQLQ